MQAPGWLAGGLASALGFVGVSFLWQRPSLVRDVERLLVAAMTSGLLPLCVALLHH